MQPIVRTPGQDINTTNADTPIFFLPNPHSPSAISNKTSRCVESMASPAQSIDALKLVKLTCADHSPSFRTQRVTILYDLECALCKADTKGRYVTTLHLAKLYTKEERSQHLSSIGENCDNTGNNRAMEFRRWAKANSGDFS